MHSLSGVLFTGLSFGAPLVGFIAALIVRSFRSVIWPGDDGFGSFGTAILLIAFSFFVGLILAVVALSRNEKHRVWSYGALVLNTAPFLILLFYLASAYG
jgi:hypothetical protein